MPCPKTYALGFPNSDVEEDTDSNVSLFADKNMYTKGNLQTSMAPASSSAVVHSVMIGQSLIETQRSSQIVPINDQLSNDTEKQQDEPTQENQKEENHHNDRHTQDSSCQVPIIVFVRNYLNTYKNVSNCIIFGFVTNTCIDRKTMNQVVLKFLSAEIQKLPN